MYYYIISRLLFLADFVKYVETSSNLLNALSSICGLYLISWGLSQPIMWYRHPSLPAPLGPSAGGLALEARAARAPARRQRWPFGGPGGIDWGRDTPKRLYKAPIDYTRKDYTKT